MVVQINHRKRAYTTVWKKKQSGQIKLFCKSNWNSTRSKYAGRNIYRRRIIFLKTLYDGLWTDFFNLNIYESETVITFFFFYPTGGNSWSLHENHKRFSIPKEANNVLVTPGVGFPCCLESIFLQEILHQSSTSNMVSVRNCCLLGA